MEEYKICPNCNQKNKSTAEICRMCNYILNDILPTTDEIEKKKKEAAEAQNQRPEKPVKPENPEESEKPECPNTATKAVKICEECGHENSTNLRKCRECGSPLPSAVASIQPIQSAQPAQSTQPVRKHFDPMLISEDGFCKFRIPAGETVIGREHELSAYLEYRLRVSRTHGKLINQGGRVFYEDLGRGLNNGTLINWISAVPGSRIELKNGDILALGDNPDHVNNERCKNAYFIFRV